MGTEKFEGKEHVLNFTAQRFQLTRPASVGPTMELINKCNPSSLSEWESYYYENAYTRKKESIKITSELLNSIGQKLYDKIQDIVIPEWTKAFEEITLENCNEYIRDVTINRSYDGFHRESAVFRELAIAFEGRILFEKTDSVTDSAWSIDYIGHILNSDVKIGLQVKPLSAKSNSGGYSISDRNHSNYIKFEKIFGGKVFEVYSKKVGKKNIIFNSKVIDGIEDFLKNME